MASISFSQVGSFNGVSGGPQVLENPTSLQFGPDGRLYVSEQNGAINAFTIEVQNGEYVATDHELLQLPSGAGVVQSIQNHNDDGTLNSIQARQVTGFVVAGTAANPVLYISSSDPRISNNGDINLDTNSGVVTRVTWNGSEWEAVDIIRGLPRSEENHSVNGLTLSPDGNTLYLAVGGNTNNGAPDAFFSFTSEFALSGTVLEIDLADLESRPILTDPNGGVNGAARQFIYDLPTLDDPTVANDGLREDANGVDVAGPFGGNDGFNQAILPADAPLRIFADGFRNNFDLVLTESGNLFTVDNGSNGGLGGDPIFVNGEATDQVSPGGTGDPEPLFLVTEGGFFGHPNPTRSNQDLEFVVRDDNGNPDASLPINTVPDLSALVPDGVDIADGFIIDPSRFTGDPDRLLESGIRVPFGSAESPALTTLGSSSNGLVEFTSDVFDGALQGALIVTQFNGNVTLLNVNEAGTGLEPLIGPGVDGLLGTADDEVIDNDGIFPLPGLSGQGLPLDVTVGPDGTIFVAEFGPDNINVFAPADGVQGFDTDFDDDGILNVNDPFTRDATNGGSATVLPGETVLFDFDANQDGNLVGPSGFGGGLTGAQINNATDFEAFFQEPSPFPGQIVNLDNVRFITAAGGGTTVVENVSNGTPFGTSNDGEFLFQTGVTIAPTVDTFTVTWNIFNPASEFATSSQRIGGFIGTGDQSNFLSITAGPDPNGEIQIVLEENDVAVASTFLQANDLFNVPANQQISFELEIDPTAGTATPTVTYETGNGTSTVSGGSISLAGTEVLEAILGNNTIQGQTTGLAVGLLSTNNADGNQPGADTFQAIFGDIEIAATGSAPPEGILFRVNAGGPQIAAVDGGPDWLADGAFLVNPGGSGTISFPAVEAGPTVDSSVPGAIFDTERFDFPGFTNLEYTFDVPEAGDYEVRLYFGEGFSGISGAGQRVFDVALEGSIPSSLDDVDLFSQFGPEVGGVISNVVTVNDGTLDIEFLAGIENPQINGIEIIQLEGGGSPPPTNPVVSIAATQDGAEPGSDGQFTVSLSEVASTDTVIAYTVGGTASAGEDFAALTETVTIAAGELTANIEVAVIDDQLDEPEESVTVTLDAVTAGDADVVIGASNAATVTITDDDEATPPDPSVLFRVNAGGPQIAAVDGGPDWLADGAFLVNPGGSGTVSFPAVEAGPTVDSSVPGAIFDTERFDFPGFTNLEYTFDVPEAGDYEVRLYFGNGFGGTSAPGQRVFDVALEGSIPSSLDDVDLSAQFGNQVGGVISNVVTVNDGTLDIELLAGVENPLINGIEIIQLEGGGSPPAPPAPEGNGEVILQVTPNSNNVQISNFGDDSFSVINVGDKNIAQIDIDVTNALFPDTVFDPMGVAGDSASRPLTITTPGGTGVVAPSSASNIGVGGVAGFEGLRITFDETVDGGFESGETLRFAIDMDPNSIAGSDPGPLTAGSDPTFDVGGVSGAEIIGSTFTVTFTDGTTASGQLQGDGSQGGSQALASQDAPNIPVALTVNGLGAGGVGTYEAGGPSVVVSGPAGETARVVLVKGFIQPVTIEPFVNGNPSQQAFAPTLQAQLDALAAEDFPANNAVEFQTVDVVLTGGAQDISDQFDFSGVANFDFEGEDELPLGFVASAIDPTNDNLPIGPVTEPIYLQFEEQAPAQIEVAIMTLQDATEPGSNGQFAVSLSEAAASDITVAYSISGTATPGEDYTALSGTVTIPAGQIIATLDVEVLDDAEVEDSESVIVTLDAVTAGDANITIGAENTATVEIGDDDFPPPVMPIASIAAVQDAAEPDSNGQFAVSLSEAAITDTVIAYTVTGTASAGEDFTALTETVTIPAGELTANIDVAVIDDQLDEPDESITVTLESITAGDNVLLGVNDTATIALADDDLPVMPIASIAAVQDAAEPDSNGQFAVSLSEAAITDTVIAYTVTGTASAGEDFTALTETVTIPAGELTASIDVIVIDDQLDEPDESITVTLESITAGDNVLLGVNDTATIALADDDVVAPPNPDPNFSFQLVDAATNSLLGQLMDGEEFVVEAGVDLDQLNVEVVVPDALGSESVVFDLNSEVQRTENVAPYTLFGDLGGNFFAGALPLGSNVISADAFSEDGGLGTLLASDTLEFTLSQSPV